MERKMFGKVVAALRKEQIDFDNCNSWSQEKLAEETGLTTRIVGKIERGSQVRLDRGTLQELARVFRLTSLERREFFAMASEIKDEAIVRADLNHQKVFAQVWATLGTLCAPAFLMDSFGDLVGANRAVLDFHKLNWSQFNAARSSAGNVNLLSLLLAPDAPLRTVLGPGWQAIALANMPSVAGHDPALSPYDPLPPTFRYFVGLPRLPDAMGGQPQTRSKTITAACAAISTHMVCMGR